MNEQDIDLLNHTLDGTEVINLTEKDDRKLASIEIIDDLKSIPNADNIEVACIKGWEVVVKKDEFKIGDKVIYIEVDSILPDKSCFEFLRSRNFRIKTIKLKGQVSQGICFPLNTEFLAYFRYSLISIEGYVDKLFLKDISIQTENVYPVEVGQDITELLQIKKYIKESTLNNLEARGNFPNFANKTDEERFQNILPLIKQNENKYVIVREKLDGSSITIYYKDGQFGVCSRNMNLKILKVINFGKLLKIITYMKLYQSIAEKIT